LVVCLRFTTSQVIYFTDPDVVLFHTGPVTETESANAHG
jgi:hypothetical protein